MVGFLSKIFGRKNDKKTIECLSEDVLTGIFEKGNFNLSFELKKDENDNLIVEIFGEDEDLLIDREGQLLDSLQLYLKRVIQHQFPDSQQNIFIDCGGFRAQADQALVDLAEKLKEVALDKGKSVYFRALPPKDRKVIHQYLSNDVRVKSRSIGDGLYKKIKIYPSKGT